VTFLALAYILSINANIIASSGGPCTSEGDCTGVLFFHWQRGIQVWI